MEDDREMLKAIREAWKRGGQEAVPLDLHRNMVYDMSMGRLIVQCPRCDKYTYEVNPGGYKRCRSCGLVVYPKKKEKK